MKKSIAFLTFLCLAVGSTGAKGLLDNPNGRSAQIDTKKLEYPIPYIPVEKRAAILPKHNICSIAPAGEPSDYFITGNGFAAMGGDAPASGHASLPAPHPPAAAGGQAG